VVVGVAVLLEGGLTGVNESNLGWMISERVSQDSNMMRNHGVGLSCGISLRRMDGPLSLA